MDHVCGCPLVSRPRAERPEDSKLVGDKFSGLAQLGIFQGRAKHAAWMYQSKFWMGAV